VTSRPHNYKSSTTNTNNRVTDKTVRLQDMTWSTYKHRVTDTVGKASPFTRTVLWDYKAVNLLGMWIISAKLQVPRCVKKFSLENSLERSRRMQIVPDDWDRNSKGISIQELTSVGLTYIHTCRSYVHTPHDFTNGANP